MSFYRPDDLPVVAEAAQSFVLDNGAFSHWRAGHGTIDVPAYHRWVQSLAGHPGLDWCLIPDVIDGTLQDNVDLVNTWLRMGSRVEGVPIWHLHEPLDWLDYLAGHFRTVAVGSSGEWATPGTPGWWRRMAQAMDVLCDETGRPRTRLHGLRMLDPEIFRYLPFASADSTNAGVNCGSLSRFGMYPPPTAAQRAAVIADRVEAFNSAATWHRTGVQQGMFQEEATA